MHSICFVGCLTARPSPLLFCVFFLFVPVCACVCRDPVIRERYTLNWALMEFSGCKDLSKNSRCWHNKQTMHAYYFHRFCIEISRAYTLAVKHEHGLHVFWADFGRVTRTHTHITSVYWTPADNWQPSRSVLCHVFVFTESGRQTHRARDAESERVRRRGWASINCRTCRSSC